jgi:hypothetical protein
MPNAVCEIAPTNFAPNLLMNRKPPFDNPELRTNANGFCWPHATPGR